MSNILQLLKINLKKKEREELVYNTENGRYKSNYYIQCCWSSYM